ncbi:MAG: sulfatase-like hydrolase/transferase [Planctomycetota bacterium]
MRPLRILVRPCLRASIAVLLNLAVLVATSTANETEAEPPPGADRMVLFNGEDLDRWRLLDQDIEHWKIVDGVLDCDALASRALWTKDAFADFELRLEWRFKTANELYGTDTDAQGAPIANQPNSGVLLRGTAQAEVNIWSNPVGSGQIWAYHRGDQSQNLSEQQRSRYCPSRPADRPLGEWNAMQITLVGEQLTVVLNGVTVIDDVPLPGIPAQGSIALQQHGGIDPQSGRYRGASSTIQFRNICLRPIRRQPADAHSRASVPPSDPAVGPASPAGNVQRRPGKSGLASATTPEQPPRPNILFLLVDDLGWMDAGFMGSRYYQTPNIDRLAGRGMVFTSAYACAPNCLPSRACMMTGQYTPRHGQYNIAGADTDSPAYRNLLKRARLKPIPNTRGWPKGTVSLQRALQQAGYRTGMIGKWHHGQSEKQSDFEYTASFGPGLHRSGDLAGPAAVERDPKLISTMTELAEKFINQQDERPFYLHLAYHAVHIPVEAQRDSVERYRTRKPEGGRCQPEYAAMIEHVDDSVGRLVEHLEQRGISDRTVVVFVSDNGGEQRCTSNAPLRGHKQEIYEGGIRVPMIVAWPGHIAPASTCEEPVIGVDFYPTFLELAGIPGPKNHLLDGQSLVPVLLGAGHVQRDAIFWHIPSYWHKCIPCCAMRAGRYKLIEFFDDPHLELYDLNSDLGEARNLVDSQPQLAKRLHDEMLAWRRQVAAPVPSERNPLYEPAAGMPRPTAAKGKPR